VSSPSSVGRSATSSSLGRTLSLLTQSSMLSSEEPESPLPESPLPDDEEPPTTPLLSTPRRSRPPSRPPVCSFSLNHAVCTDCHFF
jgi:hypothetical protein